MPTQTRNILVLAVLEGLVLTGAVLRLVLSDGGPDFSQRGTLAWFVAVVLVAGLGVTQYVLRSAMLAPRLKAGERVDDELKQILGVSVALIALAGLVVLAGPGAVAAFLG